MPLGVFGHPARRVWIQRAPDRHGDIRHIAVSSERFPVLSPAAFAYVLNAVHTLRTA